MEQIFITVFIIFVILLLIGLCLYVYIKLDDSTNTITPIQPLNGGNIPQNLLSSERITNLQIPLNQQLSLQTIQPSSSISASSFAQQQSNIPANTILNQSNLRMGTLLSESQNMYQLSSTSNNGNFRISIQRPIANATTG